MGILEYYIVHRECGVFLLKFIRTTSLLLKRLSSFVMRVDSMIAVWYYWGIGELMVINNAEDIEINYNKFNSVYKMFMQYFKFASERTAEDFSDIFNRIINFSNDFLKALANAEQKELDTETDLKVADICEKQEIMHAVWEGISKNIYKKNSKKATELSKRILEYKLTRLDILRIRLEFKQQRNKQLTDQDQQTLKKAFEETTSYLYPLIEKQKPCPLYMDAFLCTGKVASQFEWVYDSETREIIKKSWEGWDYHDYMGKH